MRFCSSYRIEYKFLICFIFYTFFILFVVPSLLAGNVDAEPSAETGIEGDVRGMDAIIAPHEGDVSEYFDDLAEDPAQVVAEDYENCYADNCL